jgi:hypothetical protein
MGIYVDTHDFDDRNICELGWTKTLIDLKKLD